MGSLVLQPAALHLSFRVTWACESLRKPVLLLGPRTDNWGQGTYTPPHKFHACTVPACRPRTGRNGLMLFNPGFYVTYSDGEVETGIQEGALKERVHLPGRMDCALHRSDNAWAGTGWRIGLAERMGRNDLLTPYPREGISLTDK